MWEKKQQLDKKISYNKGHKSNAYTTKSNNKTNKQHNKINIGRENKKRHTEKVTTI